MNRIDNPELKRKILDHLASQYRIKEKREPNHLSSYVYCRTRTYFDQKQGAEPTDEEVMLFALGYGLQDVLTPRDATAPIIEKEGVVYRPDLILSARQNEIKTTRMSAKNHLVNVKDTWLDYMLGGCYLMNSCEYDLMVLYLMGNYAPPFPQLLCDTFVFEESEVIENWQKIIAHKAVLDNCLKSNVVPEPFKNCYEWECKYCRYKLACSTLVSVLTPGARIDGGQ